jgi:hypothetical protein
MNEFFYGTPPQDTQDFSQVLRGVGRSIQDIGRGVSYYPYDLVGAPVDLINMALTPVGLGSERPVLGSDYLRNIAQSLGLAQPSTGSGTETAARFASALINPAAGARAVGKVGSDINRFVSMIDETPPRGSIDFSPRQVSSAQQVAQEIMQPKRSDIGFYSQLEAATFPMQDKGTGDQFLAQIQKTAGVKPEEIKYTGLDDFLKGKKSVTKTEIQDYLNANRVDVQEVRLGGMSPEQLALRDNALNRYREITDSIADTRLKAEQGMLSTEEAMGILRPLMAERGNLDRTINSANTSINTKFSSYTLPGGDNYRELLLTLPDTKGARLDARRAEIEAKGRNATDAEKQEWSSIMNQLQPETRDVEGLSPFRNRPEFRTTHFDQPNILAHMRVNDRTVDGKKTLFIEEIQSDWHQAGRKKGYGPQTETEAYYITPDGSRVSLGFGKTQEEAAAAVDPGWKNLVDIQFDTQTKKFGEGVPDAPFKTSWHELSLKRAIQEASEKGYDQIAFTTGKTQVERYPEALRQVADDISWSNIDESGRKYVDIKKDGNIVLQVSVDQSGKIYQSSIQDAYGKTLDEFVGKPMAQRVTSESQGTIKGQDFTVGGKGMEGFYDNILPKSLEKLGKKFDAKVGKTEMDGVEVWQMDITPKMRESVTTKGQPLFAVPAVGAGLLGAGMSQDEQMF